MKLSTDKLHERDADDPPPVVWHGVIAYDGTAFRGWQIQPGRVATVQGEIVRRLRLMYDQPDLRIAGTSRTDAGVHALDQHFSFVDPAPGRFSEQELDYRLRRWLPDNIYLKQLRQADADFHARHNARVKAYTYTVFNGTAVSPFHGRYVWHCPRKLNLQAMQAAAGRLEGTHDFTSLAGTSRDTVDDPVKTVFRIDVRQNGDFLYFNVVGNSFLYKMVRGIVGYLVLNVGLDADWTPAKTRNLLAKARRETEVQTAPAKGLFLAKVFFSTDEWEAYRPLLPPFATGIHPC